MAAGKNTQPAQRSAGEGADDLFLCKVVFQAGATGVQAVGRALDGMAGFQFQSSRSDGYKATVMRKSRRASVCEEEVGSARL